MKRYISTSALLLGLLAWLLPTAQAEQKERFDNYDVHYSIVNSTFLSPQVAKTYGIVRGDDRFIINIAVRENLDNGSTVARKAEISGSRFDLIHRITLDFMEIDEGTAIYYIAQFQANDKEKLDFTLKIHPETSRRSYKMQFNKVMYESE
ncbi:MAG TPA: DUF4426 domain-containing protein [Spongiibacteraceae bacterium]|nr:hypothetical protein [Spongiibacteraceae bacterium]HCS27579.1 DUF4426 domain-containing protein [Spongiibacteraceae bacterium]|tara:strand:- start:193 stop:642 length:450 start_codon:yes stop_codon:yes gene_type:complete